MTLTPHTAESLEAAERDAAHMTQAEERATREIAQEAVVNKCIRIAELEAALRQCVDALEKADKISGYANNKKAITAGKEALK